MMQPNNQEKYNILTTQVKNTSLQDVRYELWSVWWCGLLRMRLH